MSKLDEPIRIAICEDTSSEAEKLCSMLDNSPFSTEYKIFSSGEDFLNNYSSLDYDLILMDIYMKGMNGLETISKVREFDKDIPVAFITTSLDHTLESYRLSALRYIEKPFRQEDIDDILKLAQSHRESSPCLIISRNNTFEKIRTSQITYIEQHARTVSIYRHSGNTIEIYDKISNLSKQLDEHIFVIPHKSYVVNLAYVKEIDFDLRTFIMKDGQNIPIRRESMGKAKKIFADYLFDNTRRV